MRDSKTTRTYSITELCERFDVTPRTLRYYEEIGLLTPQRRGTHRVYNERDRVRLQLILRGRRLGFSLEEIREILELYDRDKTGRTQLKEALRKGEEKLRAIEAQIAELEAMRRELQERAAEIRRMLEEEG